MSNIGPVSPLETIVVVTIALLVFFPMVIGLTVGLVVRLRRRLPKRKA